MKPRKLPLGDMNIVGASITHVREEKHIKQKDLLAKLQAEGMEITASGLSKIEGQARTVTDKELYIISKVLGVAPSLLLAKS